MGATCMFWLYLIYASFVLSYESGTSSISLQMMTCQTGLHILCPCPCPVLHVQVGIRSVLIKKWYFLYSYRTHRILLQKWPRGFYALYYNTYQG